MMTFEGLRRHVAGLVGSDNVWTDDVRLAAHAIDRRKPRLVVQPETTAQAADILALPGRERFAVVPWGQGKDVCRLGRGLRLHHQSGFTPVYGMRRQAYV